MEIAAIPGNQCSRRVAQMFLERARLMASRTRRLYKLRAEGRDSESFFAQPTKISPAFATEMIGRWPRYVELTAILSRFIGLLRISFDRARK